MKKNQALSIMAASLTLFSYAVSAQVTTPKKDTTAPKKSHWVIGTTYQSDAVYLGRKDSVAIPYFTPSIGYHDKSGFFVTGSLSYLPGSGASRIDLVSIEGGYAYSSDKVNLEISATKDFYSDQSFAVTSEIGARLSGSFSYDFGPVEPSLDLGAEFSGQTDIGLGLGIAHSFSLIEDKLELDPTFHVNMATQNYYANYYNKRRYSAKRQGGNGSSNTKANVKNASNFQVMDYEFEAPLEYTYSKKLKFTFTPTLAMPVNPSTITLTTTKSGSSSTQSTTEKLSTVFYFSLGVSYTF